MMLGISLALLSLGICVCKMGRGRGLEPLASAQAQLGAQLADHLDKGQVREAEAGDHSVCAHSPGLHLPAPDRFP